MIQTVLRFDRLIIILFLLVNLGYLPYLSKAIRIGVLLRGRAKRKVYDSSWTCVSEAVLRIRITKNAGPDPDPGPAFPFNADPNLTFQRLLELVYLILDLQKGQMKRVSP
jgi:hypothetical protein